MSAIDKLVQTPLPFKDLHQMLGGDAEHVSFFLYDNLAEKTFHDLLEKPASIIYLDIEGENAPKVGHFIAILNYPDYVEHFDSYGLSIEQELHFTHDRGTLHALLQDSGKRVIENTFKFQLFKDDSATCGRWCVARCRLMGMKLEEFRDFFESEISTMDEKVTLLTFFK
jgi:hypothetical protein